MRRRTMLARLVIISLALPVWQLSGAGAGDDTQRGSILVPATSEWRLLACDLVGNRQDGVSFREYEVTPNTHFQLDAVGVGDDFDIEFLKEEFDCRDGADPSLEPHSNADAGESGAVPFDAKVAIVYLWLGEPGAEFTFSISPAPSSEFDELVGLGVQQDTKAHTVVAVVDGGFNPYHFDFVGHHHPWNLDADPLNDFDSLADPSTYIEGYPSSIPIDLTIPVRRDERVDKYRSGRDADEWSKLEPSTSDDVKMYRFLGTKVIGAVNFDPDFEFWAGNTSHGTRSAASAVGNIHGSCPECLVVLINGAEPEALAWAAAQPWIDVITNSYGHSLTGGVVRDNIYFGSALNATRDSSDDGQFVVFSAGNGLLNAFDVPMLTYWSSEKGPDWMITVGAASPRGKQQYSGAGKPVDVSSIGSSYPSTGGVTATGVGTHSGTSNAAPVTAGTIAKVIQSARQLLGDSSAGHSGSVVASGAAYQCGDVNLACPLEDGVVTRIELQNVVFRNVVPSGSRVEINTTWPSTAYSYYYQGHGLIRGRIDGREAFDQEQAQMIEAMKGVRAELPRPPGEKNWFIVDSKCRQRLWGNWRGGYFSGDDPVLDEQKDPIASTFNRWCSLTPDEALHEIASAIGEPDREGMYKRPVDLPEPPSAAPAAEPPAEMFRPELVLGDDEDRAEREEAPVVSAGVRRSRQPVSRPIALAVGDQRRTPGIVALSFLVAAAGLSAGFQLRRRLSRP